MDSTKLMNFLLLCVMGFAGGFMSDHYLRDRIVMTATYEAGDLTDFYDAGGKRRLDVGMLRDHPIEDFFDANQALRLQLGTYSTQIRASEEGLPSVALYDSAGLTKMVIRLDGPNQGPLIIMKDKQENNRLIFGLDIWDGEEAPFLVTWDKNGKQKDILGHFVMKPL